MIEANTYRDIPTSLDLNGPYISIATHPTSATRCNAGTVSFVGSAIATFPTQTPPNPATNTGTFSYQWYRVGVGALTDGPNISGSQTTTLTLSNVLSPDDHLSQYYFIATHSPSAYGNPGIGAGRSTGNALNGPTVTSNTATLTVYPKLTLETQPVDTTALINTNATIFAVGGLTDYTQGPIQYQWYIDGVAVSDGTRVTTSPANVVQTNYFSDAVVNIPDNATNVSIRVVGAAGGIGGNTGGAAGAGRGGTFAIPDGQRTLTLSIGSRGSLNTAGTGGLVVGGTPGINGGGGGSAVSVFDSVSNSYIVVAGGGGGGGSGSNGTPGGIGQDAGNWIAVAGGITGFTKGGDSTTGTGNIGGGGGGGGVPGGSGGPAGEFSTYSYTVQQGLGYSGIGCDCCNCSCPCQRRFGGDAYCGGQCKQPPCRDYCGRRDCCTNECFSCFRNVTVSGVTAAIAGGGNGGGSAYNSNVATLTSTANALGVTPFVTVTYTAPGDPGITQITTTTTISGAATNALTLRANTVTVQNVQCRISHPLACESPIFSNIVRFETISAANLTRSIVTSEVVDDTDSSVFLRNDVNLYTSPITFNANNDTNHNRTINIYAPEENVSVRITMAGAAGQGFNGQSGGQGGLSTFTYTLKRNTEYTFRIGNLNSTSTSRGQGGGAAFFYEKGRLLAVCGGGGASGFSGGIGGAGGGVDVAGASGSGSGAGAGGIRAAVGQLPAAGVTPSGVNGGKVETCTSGDYWKNLGVSACSDVGSQQFRIFTGTAVTPSATLQRGYKATSSSGFRNSGGNSATIASGSYIGGGGSGAYGGNATTSPAAGGGGGSGYSNGSVNIISTQQGGNPSKFAYFTIELNQ